MSNHNGNTLSENEKKALNLAATLDGLEAGSNDYDALDSQLNDLWFGSNFTGRRSEWLESLGYQKASTTTGQEPVEQTVVETNNVNEEQPIVEEEQPVVEEQPIVEDQTSRPGEVNLIPMYIEGQDFSFSVLGSAGTSQTMNVREQPDGTISIGGERMEQEPEYAEYAKQDHVVVGKSFDGQEGGHYRFDEETNTWYAGDTPILKYLPGTGTYKGMTSELAQDNVASAFGKYLENQKNAYEIAADESGIVSMRGKYFKPLSTYKENSDGKLEYTGEEELEFDAGVMAYMIDLDVDLPNASGSRNGEILEIVTPDGERVSFDYRSAHQDPRLAFGWTEETKNYFSGVMNMIHKKYDDEDYKIKASEAMWGLFGREDNEAYGGVSFDSAEGLANGLEAAGYSLEYGPGTYTLTTPDGNEILFQSRSYGQAADELQNWVWNNMPAADRQKINEYALGRFEEAKAIVEEAKAATRAETEALGVDQIAANARLNVGGSTYAGKTFDIFLEASGIENLDMEEFAGNYFYFVKNGKNMISQEISNLTNIESTKLYKEASAENKVKLKQAAETTLEYIDIKMSEYTDGLVSRTEEIHYENLLHDEFNQDAGAIRGVIDQKTNTYYVEPRYHEEDGVDPVSGDEFKKGDVVEGTGVYITLQEKADAVKSQVEGFELAANTKATQIDATMKNLLKEIEGEGFGYKSEGDVKNGTFRVVVDYPKTGSASQIAEAEAKAKEFQERLNTVVGSYVALDNTLNNQVETIRQDMLNILADAEQSGDLATIVNREVDQFEVVYEDWVGAWRNMSVNTIGSLILDDDDLREKQRTLQERAQAFRSGLTWEEAEAVGDWWGGYATRTFVQNAPNMIVAMGIQVAGATIGIPPVGSGLITGAVFGQGAQEDTKFQMESDRNKAQTAKEDLESLTAAHEKGLVSDAQFFSARQNLTSQIALGDYTDDQITKMRMASFGTETLIGGLFGQIPNAARNVRRYFPGLFGGTNNLLESAGRQWYNHVGRAAWNIGREVTEEVLEEVSIYAVNEYAGANILGTEWEGWAATFTSDEAKEIALSTIVSAGPNQGASNVYAGITGHMQSKSDRQLISDVKSNIQSIFDDMNDPNVTSAELQNLTVQLNKEYGRLTNLQSSLELKALLAGPEGVESILKANHQLTALYEEAGVKPGDSQATIDKKIEAHKKKPFVNGSRFDSRLQRAENALQQEQDKINQAFDGDFVDNVTKLYGEQGTIVADQLSEQNPGFDDLSNGEKLQAVHNQMMEFAKEDNRKTLRNMQGVSNAMEMVVYDGKTFEESGRSTRDIDAENYYLDQIAAHANMDEKTTVTAGMQSRQGKISLESISSDPNISDKIGVTTFETEQDIYDDLKRRRTLPKDQGGITGKEYRELKAELDKTLEKRRSMRAEAAKKGEVIDTFGFIVPSKDGMQLVTLSNEADSRAQLEKGNLQAGIVALHETSHALDNLAGITGQTAAEYANLLREGALKSGDQNLIDAHVYASENALLGNKVGTEGFNQEYITHFQDHVSKKDSAGRSRFTSLKNQAGKTSWTDIFRKRQDEGDIASKGFQIKNSKDAFTYMVANIEAFRSGEVSKLTQSRIDAGLGENFNGGSRMSATDRQASNDVQRIFEEEYMALPESERPGSEPEGKMLELMELPISNMARRIGLLTDWDNFDQENLEAEITNSSKKRGATSLIRDYDPRSAEYVLQDGKRINALVSKKGGLTIDREQVEDIDYYFKDRNNPTQGEIDKYITDVYGPIKTRNQVPVAGYVFQQLNLRMPEFITGAKLRTAEGFALNVDELNNLLGVEEDFSERADVVEGREAGTILLANQLGPEGLAIAEMIVEDYEAGNINADGKTYKSLPVPDRVLDAVFKMMGVDPVTKKGTRKTGNLDQTDVLNAQRWLDKNLQVFRNAVPLHHSTKMVNVPVIEAGKKKLDDQGRVVTRLTPRPDKATGIPKVLLVELFDEHSRKDNLASWMPKDLLDSELKAVFGITKRGEQNLFTKDSNSSQRIRAAASVLARAMTNQSVKIAKMAANEGEAFAFEDGKNPALFSATNRKMSNGKPFEKALALEVIKGITDPKNRSKLKNSKGSILNILDDKFVTKFSQEYDIPEKMVMSRLVKVDDETKEKFAKYNKVPAKASIPMIDRSLEDLAVDHIIDDVTNHHQVYKDMVGEDDFLDLNDPKKREVAAQGVTVVANHIRNTRGAAWFNRFIIPGLTSSFNPKRGAIFVPPKNIDASKRDWVRNELGVLMSNEDMKNIDMPPSNYMDGNLDNDGVRKQRNNLENINKSQRENNQALRDLTDDLSYLVALNKSDPSKGITFAQATSLLAALNSNQQGLTRSSAILDGFPTKPFELVPAFNKDGSPKLDANGKQVMLGAVLEHATPALQINQAALRTIDEATLDMFDENGKRLPNAESDAHTEFNGLMDNYMTIYLPKKYDDMVNVNNKYTTPFWQKFDDSPFGRYFGPLMIALGMDLEIEIPSLGITLGGDGGIKPDAWKKYNDLRKKAIGDLAKGTDIATDQKTVKDLQDATRSRMSATKRKGMTAWDFDDTLATTKSNVIFTKDGETKIVSAEDFAKQGADLIAEGWTPDFSEFNEVKGGKPGPEFDRAMKRAKKYGTKDTFILTARPPEAAPAIKKFLDSLGLNIPLKNITGLANSTGEAKARWLLDKHAQGYNDIAFVDDAMQNIDAVQKVFNQFDIKGEVEQARGRFSAKARNDYEQTLDNNFNKILEESKDIAAEKTFSRAKARQRGKNKGRFKFFLPPSAEDFKGLIYPMLGKGEQGEKHHKFFKENLFDPYARGMRRLNSVQQETSADLRALKRNNKDARSKLKKNVPGTEFTYEQAIRVYNWNRLGVEVPGLSQADLNKLVNAVKSDPAVRVFADGVQQILDKPGINIDPGDNWLGGTISMDIMETIDASRDVMLEQFNTNADIIFSEANLNKLEAMFGSNYREAMEDMLYRMKTGSTRNRGSNRLVNSFTQWVNGSVGTVMFFNARSAMLQMLSSVNFVNWSDNNLLAAGKAFANQKQYWGDVSMIFNSDFLKQRRAGIGTDLNAAELLKELQGSKNPMKTAISYLLQLGFTPTQAADSLAIATGGATFYRNRLNTYLKQGMSQQEAETKAFQDMREIAEETQQSTRPDKISQQQASPLGKWILAFQNTPMQYNRIIKRAAQDWVNGRGDAKTHASKIVYYGAVQSMLFYGLQNALFSSMFGDDDEEKEDEKKERVVNGMIDSLLRGSGVGGAVISTVKNTIIEFMEQEEKAKDDLFYTEPDHAYTLIETLNLSPPIGIKARKLYGAAQTWEFNRDVIEYMPKTDIDNPLYDATFSATEALTNIPLSRLHNKVLNIREAMNSDHETWKRVAMFLGWSRWSFGIENQDVADAKGEIKEIKAAEAEERREQKKLEREIEKAEEERQIIEDHKLDQQEKRDQGATEVQCAAVTGSGERCSNMALPGEDFCTVHMPVPQGNKEVQCSHIKSDGKRCKMKTKNKSGKCYYHD